MLFRSKWNTEIEELRKSPDKLFGLSSSNAPPKRNPLVLDALLAKQPKNLIELATTYGELFAEHQKLWLEGLLKSSLEAVPGATVLTDGHAEHLVINSPSHRQLRKHLYGEGTPFVVPEEDASKITNRTIADMISGKRGAIHGWNLSAPGSPPRAMVMVEKDKPEEQRVFLRGNPLTRGPTVTPHFLSALDKEPQAYKDGKRRLGLAQSIVSNQNPLTARVLVNWVWQHHFGVGLVGTPDDFGTRGQPPSHPELLDYLADEFRKHGWSIQIGRAHV